MDLFKSIGWQVRDVRGLDTTNIEQFYAKAFLPNDTNNFLNIKTNKDLRGFLFEFKISHSNEVIKNIESFKDVVFGVFIPNLIKDISSLGLSITHSFPIISVKKLIVINESRDPQYIVDSLNDFMNASHIINDRYYELEQEYLDIYIT